MNIKGLITSFKRKTPAQVIEFLATYVYRILSQKSVIIDNVPVKYIIRKKRKSSKLIVVLSACTAPGVRSRYNYMRTLKSCNENQLFIVDEYGEDGRGAYYLGQNCGNEIEKACTTLVQQIAEKLKADTIFFCGSSKGGWAALNLMTNFAGGGVFLYRRSSPV